MIHPIALIQIAVAPGSSDGVLPESNGACIDDLVPDMPPRSDPGAVGEASRGPT